MKTLNCLLMIPVILFTMSCKKENTVVMTEFGEVIMNSKGEYLTEDWDLYLKLFKKAVKERDRELLKKLCIRDVIYDEIKPDGTHIYWGQLDLKDNKNKTAIDHIDFDLIEYMLKQNLYYDEITTSEGIIIKTYTYAKSNPPREQEYFMEFFYSSDWKCWWFNALEYVSDLDI